MDNVDAAQERQSAGNRAGLLYAVMLIAAISVILFTIAGTATIMGWVPETRPAGKAAPVPASKPAPPRGASAGCVECGVIESIHALHADGEATGLGVVAGGVLGGLIGSQLGSGHGAATATVIAAGAGAVAGDALEKSARAGVRIRVRMADGSVRTVYDRAQRPLEVGQKVRVTNHGLTASG